MEPTKLDDLFRKSVEDHEGNAVLSKEKQNALWTRIENSPREANIWMWKVACVILLAFSGVLSLLLLQESRSKDENIKYIEVAPKVEESISQKVLTDVATPVGNQKEEVEKEVVVKNIVKYVDREKIVYVEKEVEKKDQSEIDSLLLALEDRETLIKKLNHQLASAITSDYEPTANNVQVAFRNDNTTSEYSKKSESKIKFQLALFNTNKP